MNVQGKSLYHEVHAHSLADPQGFWAEAAKEIDWIEPPKKIFDAAQGVYGRWFTGGVVNTCYNALDRHVERGRADQVALIHDSPLTNSVTKFTYAELLAEVQSRYNIRKDEYSRAITGLSSGGICAFNVAWWQPVEVDGGNVYPNKVRKEPNRNIRVWMQDGEQDLENIHGSWPLQNIQLANSLKLREYDFHFSFGQGNHNSAHGSSELPESLTWLWRDYDPAKTEQAYQMDSAEKSKPYFRVKIANRE